MFVFFLIAYVSRAVIYLLTSFEIISLHHVVYSLLFIVWDILPLAHTMAYHRRTFEIERITGF